jgi:hypothetical protein
MAKRFLNQTAITGYGSILLSVFTIFQEGVQMNITSWILAILGAGLIIYAAIKTPNTRPTKTEIDALVNTRMGYLPDLQNVIEKKIHIHDELKLQACNCPFEEYGKKYFWGNKQYRDSMKKHPNDINFALQTGFWSSGFVLKNILYQDLIKADIKISGIESQYDLIFSKIKDKKLRKFIKDYWWYEFRANSLWIFMEMMKVSNVKIELTRRKLAHLGVDAMVNMKSLALKRINTRTDELLDGAEDE